MFEVPITYEAARMSAIEVICRAGRTEADLAIGVSGANWDDSPAVALASAAVGEAAWTAAADIAHRASSNHPDDAAAAASEAARQAAEIDAADLVEEASVHIATIAAGAFEITVKARQKQIDPDRRGEGASPAS